MSSRVRFSARALLGGLCIGLGVGLGIAGLWTLSIGASLVDYLSDSTADRLELAWVQESVPWFLIPGLAWIVAGFLILFLKPRRHVNARRPSIQPPE